MPHPSVPSACTVSPQADETVNGVEEQRTQWQGNERCREFHIFVEKLKRAKVAELFDHFWKITHGYWVYYVWKVSKCPAKDLWVF